MSYDPPPRKSNCVFTIPQINETIHNPCIISFLGSLLFFTAQFSVKISFIVVSVCRFSHQSHLLLSACLIVQWLLKACSNIPSFTRSHRMPRYTTRRCEAIQCISENSREKRLCLAVILTYVRGFRIQWTVAKQKKFSTLLTSFARECSCCVLIGWEVAEVVVFFSDCLVWYWQWMHCTVG